MREPNQIMHEDQHKEQLLAKWLEGELNAAEQAVFERLCLEDEVFSSQVETANSVNFTAQQFETVEVPAWDKDSTFIEPHQPKWWQWQGLPAMSMAVSACAMLMVVTGFNVKVADGSVTIGFSGEPDQAAITALVDQKLADYQVTNQTLFTQYVDALSAQQQQSSAQLTEYLLSSSRQERKEDFAELVKFINQQRRDDQRFYARQINNLQEEIYSLDAAYDMSQSSSVVNPMILDNE